MLYICKTIKIVVMKLKDTFFSYVKRIDKGNNNKNLFITKKVNEIIGRIKLNEINLIDDNEFCNDMLPLLKMLPDRKYNIQEEKHLFFVTIWNKENNIVKHTFFGMLFEEVVIYDIEIDMVTKSIKCGYRHNSKNDKLFDNKLRLVGYKDFHEYMKEHFLHSLKNSIFIELSSDKVKLVDIKPKEKHGDFLKGTEIKNQTDITITKVDSLWNVTTIGVGEFKVRGHFRLQPCGVGFSERKLIYIDEFIKTHYIRRSTRDIVFEK